MNNIWILAEGDGEITSTPAGTKPADETTTTPVVEDNGKQAPPEKDTVKRETSPWQYAPLVILFIVMYFLLIKGPKKKQQKHTQMVKSIEKNARIQTIGGIIGTVINVKENEIIIKIDESNNTKMTISKGAVSKVLSDEIS